MFGAPIDWLDVVIILLLATGLVLGYVQGLIQQLIGLGSLYLGAILATQYFHVISNAFKSMLLTTPVQLLNAIAFLLIMFSVRALLDYLALDAYRVRLRLVSSVDHLGGMVLGTLGMWILITLALNVIMFGTGARSWEAAEPARVFLRDGIQGSRLVEAAQATLPSLIASIKPWLPTGMPAIFTVSS